MNRLRLANIILIPIISLIILMSQCKSENKQNSTSISLTDLQKAQLDTFSTDSSTLLNIIKVYPIQKDCNTSMKYANLYICAEVSRVDTVYVFEECREVSKEAFDPINYYPYIDKKKMTVPSSDKISVFVPSDFKLNRKFKYFYGRIDFFLGE